MNPTQTQRSAPQVDPGALLPAEWSLELDVLLVVGEDAGVIAQRFADYGLQRVVAMFPTGVPVEPTAASVTVVKTRQALNDAVLLFPGARPQRFAMIRTPRCSASREDTAAINRILANAVQLRRSNETVVDDLSPLWATNGLKNLPEIAKRPLVNDVGEALAGVPLIVVGSGPSLSKNIHLLQHAKGRAIVLCVARALRSLQRAGVQPDLAINAEPQDVACQFDGIDASALTGLVLCTTSHSSLYGLDAANILSYVGNGQSDDWMLPEPVDLVSSGGSVSCSGVGLGVLWKCDPIILVGQDLSFPGGAYYHSDGADGDARAVRDEASGGWRLEGHSDELRRTVMDRTSDGIIRMRGTKVPGYFGGLVDTSYDFAQFREWLQNTALDHPTTQFFNCTEGGARIDGMTHIPLIEVLRTLSPHNVDLHEAFNSDEVQAAVNLREPVMRARDRTVRAGLANAIRQAQRCVELIDSSRHDHRALRKLAKAEAALKQTTKTMTVLSLMDQRVIHKVIERSKTAQTQADKLHAARMLYQFIADDGQRLLSAVSP
ncbi:MAG: 6-hydroxymethylpterin diphosphokinase MptE-like protein [Myxococcota bacterium]|nr:6-hydroxymethylpterin diphosphokinase MptE-like protein [Myxococcota bacterium]